MTTEEKAVAYDKIIEALEEMEGFENYPPILRVDTAIHRSNHLAKFGERSRDAWQYTFKGLHTSILNLMRDLNNS
jgi:hypothetical protein